MGANASTAVATGGDAEADKLLIQANEEIFSSEFLERHTSDLPPPLVPTVSICPEDAGTVLGRFAGDGNLQFEDVLQQLRQGVTTLTQNRRSSKFSVELDKRLHVLQAIHEAFQREQVREQSRQEAKALSARSKLASSSSKLSVGSKLGIESIIRIMLILISTTRRHDKGVIWQILELSASLLEEAPPLSLSNSPEFSPDIGESLEPLVQFVRDLACSTTDGAEIPLKALQILLGLALARGSLAQLLAVVDMLLCSKMDGNDRVLHITKLLQSLFEHRHNLPTSKSDEEVERDTDGSDASIVDEGQRSADLSKVVGDEGESASSAPLKLQFPTSPAEIVKRFAPDWRNESEGISGSVVVRLILSQIDRLSSEFGPSSPPSEEDGSNDSTLVDETEKATLLQHPLGIDVSLATLSQLSSIIERAGRLYFTSDTSCNDEDYSFYMYATLVALRLLKVHLYHFSKAGLPLRELGFNHKFAASLRAQVFRFLQHEACPRSSKAMEADVTKAIQSEAAQAFAEGFKFFYSSVHEQVVYLTALMDKRAPGSSQTLSWPEKRILDLLLSRFSSFGAASSLIDEAVGRDTEEITKSREAIARVFSSLLSLCVSDALEALSSREETPIADIGGNGALQILQGFQSHLLSRAASVPKQPGEQSTALHMVEEYSLQLLRDCGTVVQRAEMVLTQLQTQTDGTQAAMLAVGRTLSRTLVGKLGRPLVSALCKFARNDQPALLLLRLLPKAAEFLKVLDSLCASLDRCSVLELREKATQTAVVESRHPHVRSIDRRTLLQVPGASSIEVTFDPRCCTLSENDYVQLLPPTSTTTNTASIAQLSARFYGDAASNWPTEPIRIEGDSCIVHFRCSDESTSEADSSFGYRISASGVVERTPLSWLLDFAKTMTWLGGSMARSLVVGAECQGAKRFDALLAHPVLAGGISSSHPAYPCLPPNAAEEAMATVRSLETVSLCDVEAVKEIVERHATHNGDEFDAIDKVARHIFALLLMQAASLGEVRLQDDEAQHQRLWAEALRCKSELAALFVRSTTPKAFDAIVNGMCERLRLLLYFRSSSIRDAAEIRQAVLSFCLQDVDISCQELYNAFLQRRLLAVHRIIGLRWFGKMLQSLSIASLVPELLRCFSDALHTAEDSESALDDSQLLPPDLRAFHQPQLRNGRQCVAVNLNSVGENLQSAIADEFFNFLDVLLSGRHELDENATLLTFDLLADACASPHNLPRLGAFKLVEFLEPFLGFCGSNAGILHLGDVRDAFLRLGRRRLQPWNLRFAAWSVFRVFLYNTVLSQHHVMSEGALNLLERDLTALDAMRRYEGMRILRQNLVDEKDDERTQNILWSCTACTFLNEADSSSCAMCSLAFSEHMRKREELEDTVGPTLPSTSTELPDGVDRPTAELEMVYESDLDTNGVIYHLGTLGGTEFINPAESGVVQVRYASLQNSSCPASAVVGRQAVRCVSKPHVNQWFVIDLLGNTVRPNYYTLRHYSSYSVEALRNWRFEGSCDGQTWSLLREHQNDESLRKKGQAFSWPLAVGENDFYSMFRVFMTGQNSNNSWYLALSGFELYGTLRLSSRLSPPPPASPPTATAAAAAADVVEMQPLRLSSPPPIPATASQALSVLGADPVGGLDLRPLSVRMLAPASEGNTGSAAGEFGAFEAGSASTTLDGARLRLPASLLMDMMGQLGGPSKQTEQNDWWDTSNTQKLRFEGSVAQRPTTVVNLSTSNNWQVVKSVQSYSSGVHKMQVRIDHSGPTSNTWKIVVGVVPIGFKVNSTISRCVGGSQGGWGYVGSTGTKYNSSNAESYGPRFGSNDVIGIVLDFNNSTIEFLKNNASLSVAFNNLCGPVNLAVSFTATDTRFTLLPSTEASNNGVILDDDDVDDALPVRSTEKVTKVSKQTWTLRASTAHLGDASVCWYAHNRTDVGLRGLPIVSELPSRAELELFAAQWLWALLRAASLAPTEIANRPRLLRLLLSFAISDVDNSPVSAVLALRVCGALFACVAPATLAVHLRTPALLTQLLDVHASASAAVASEAVALLRSLMNRSSWAPSINALLLHSVREAASSTSSSDSAEAAARLRRVHGALAVLGGRSEALREGARVALSDTHECGALLCVSTGGRALVQLDSGAPRLVPLTIISVLDRVPLPALQDPDEVARALVALVLPQNAKETLLQAQLRSQALRALDTLLALEERVDLETRVLNALVAFAVTTDDPSYSNKPVELLERLRHKLADEQLVRKHVEKAHPPGDESNEFRPLDGSVDDSDERGILFFLGCRFGAEPFMNPHTIGLVTLTASSVGSKSSAPASVLCSRDAQASFFSENSTYERISIDLGKRQVRLTAVALRHWSLGDNAALRSWKLEGHNNDSDDSDTAWHTLALFNDDARLKKRRETRLFPVVTKDFFNSLRLTMTGPNASGSWTLALGGIELYGWLKDENGELMTPACRSKTTTTTIVPKQLTASTSSTTSLPLRRRRIEKDKQTCEPGSDPGFLMSFGKGDSGRLGHSSTNPLSTPSLLPELAQVKIQQVSSFGSHVVVLSAEGKVYTFGNGDHGRLGHGNRTQQREPKLVEALAERRVCQAVGGNAFSMALDVDGCVWVWGQGSNGQMGDGNSSDRLSPILVEGALKAQSVVCIGAGGYHAFAVLASGQMFAWGKNQYGQLGINSTTLQKTPMRVELPVGVTRFVQLCGGWDHSMALTPEGKLYTWGGGYELRRPVCGHGNNEKQLQPKLVEALGNEVVVQVAAGWDHSMAVTNKGHVYCWGGNNSGSLGNGQSSQHEFVPCRVLHGLESERVVWVDGGQDHTCVVTVKGELWTWGSGGTHLGHQDSTSRCVPKCMESSRGRHIFQLVSCGQKSNFLLTSNRPPAVPLHPVTFGMDNTSSAPFPPYPRSLYLVSKLNDGSRRLHDSCRPQRSALICGGFRYSDEDNAVVVQPDFRLVLPLDWSVLAEAQRDLTVMLSRVC